ncbi:MAG: conjugal transfer protein TraG N-terminal domain-containing protein [Sodalis sp. (in: enterobacteria)]|uniref:conjugal transfer protein TraG N-terminal domain-containing protein n=1 Tax=Sodalis sp. (in: enterobacteria) TaxID=1898979 RepID=UPI0039E2EAF5
MRLLDKVTHTANSLLAALKMPEAAHQANQVLGDMQFPQLSSLLPYRDYDEHIKQNVVMNGLRSGILSYAARSNDTAGMLNIATTSALEKQRLSQATVGQVAIRMLPTLHVMMMGILMGVFPLIVLVGMVNQGWQVFKGYVFAWLWLMSWPLLYAILNGAMVFYARCGDLPKVIQ